MKKLQIQQLLNLACLSFAASHVDSGQVSPAPIPGVIASDIAFVNGDAVNIFGKIVQIAQNEADALTAAGTQPAARIVQPRKMNGISSREVLAMCLGVSSSEIPKNVVDLINELNAVSVMNDEVFLKINQLGQAMTSGGTIGRKPGKPRKAVVTPAV